MDDYLVSVLSNIGVISFIALSAYLLLLTGEISFGQQAFFAIGAYAAGIATALWGWPLSAALVWGAVTAGAAAVLVGVAPLAAVHPARKAPEHRVDHDPAAPRDARHIVQGLPDDLVPGGERQRDHGRQVRRVATGEQSQVGAADAGQDRLDPCPAVVSPFA